MRTCKWKILLCFVIAVCSLRAAPAQSRIVPIIDMRVGGLLGGVQNRKFVKAERTIAKMPAEQKYTLYKLNAKTERVSLRKPTVTMEEVCPDFYTVPSISGKTSEELTEADIEQENKRREAGGVAIGDGIGWKPQPRKITSIDLNSKEYIKVMADFLRTKRIGPHEIKLKQAIRVDLEGDGVDEVLLVATRQFSYEVKDGKKAFDEYSVVLLRRLVRGKPRVMMVAGEVHPKNKDLYDGNVFELSSVLDLNGDGKLELVIYSEYYEGNAAQVYSVTGGKPVANAVLNVGCGL